MKNIFQILNIIKEPILIIKETKIKDYNLLLYLLYKKLNINRIEVLSYPEFKNYFLKKNIVFINLNEKRINYRNFFRIKKDISLKQYKTIITLNDTENHTGHFWSDLLAFFLTADLKISINLSGKVYFLDNLFKYIFLRLLKKIFIFNFKIYFIYILNFILNVINKIFYNGLKLFYKFFPQCPKAKEKKKILYVSHEARFNGAPLSLLNFLIEVDRSKIEPIIVFPERNNFTKKFEDIGCKVYIVKTGRLLDQNNNIYWKFYGNLYFISAAIQLLRIITKEQIDIIHINTSVQFIPALIGKLLKIPVVYHFRETIQNEKYRNKISKILHKNSSKIICISKFAYNHINDSKCEKCKIVYNPISEKCYKNLSTNMELLEKLKKNNYTIISIISQITDYKGQHIIIEMLKRTKQYFNKVKFLIVGRLENYPYINHLLNLIEKYGLEDFFILTGEQSNIAHIYKYTDITVFPTLWQEMFGRVIIESYYFNIPVVANNRGGIKEILKDGQTGFLIKRKKIDNIYYLLWASKIRRLIEDKKLYKYMQRNIKLELNKYKSSIYNEKILEIYNGIISKFSK